LFRTNRWAPFTSGSDITEITLTIKSDWGDQHGHHRKKTSAARNLENPYREPAAGFFISDLQAPEARHIKDAVAWRCITLAKPAGARPVFMSSDPQRSPVHAILLPCTKSPEIIGGRQREGARKIPAE
jgi:hypothetical protein